MSTNSVLKVLSPFSWLHNIPYKFNLFWLHSRPKKKKSNYNHTTHFPIPVLYIHYFHCLNSSILVKWQKFKEQSIFTSLRKVPKIWSYFSKLAKDRENVDFYFLQKKSLRLKPQHSEIDWRNKPKLTKKIVLCNNKEDNLSNSKKSCPSVLRKNFLQW